MTLKIYEKSRPCPKCGVNDDDCVYTHGKIWRKCKNCQYNWAERPVDEVIE